MALPKDVAEAITNMDMPVWDEAEWQIVHAHLLSQDAEIATLRAMIGVPDGVLPSDAPRAITRSEEWCRMYLDERSRADLAESRLAAADALLREIDRNGVLSQGVRARITEYMQGADDEA